MTKTMPPKDGQPQPEKPASHRGVRRSAPVATSPQARRQAAAILEVLAGVRRPSEAAQVLGTSLVRYYQLERRALLGLVRACEPTPRGPGVNPSRRIGKLERENRRLQRECDRQQALVRSVERSLGLAMPAAVKPSAAKGKKEEPSGNGSPKRRRRRRPSVRALCAIRSLQLDVPTAAESDGASAAAAEVSASV